MKDILTRTTKFIKISEIESKEFKKQILDSCTMVLEESDDYKDELITVVFYDEDEDLYYSFQKSEILDHTGVIYVSYPTQFDEDTIYCTVIKPIGKRSYRND